MGEVSRLLLLSNGNDTTVVDRLEKDGFVTRKPSEGDKRVVLVGLTPAGKAWFKDLAAAHEAEINTLFSDLGHDEISTIRDLMQRLEGEPNDKDV